MEYVLIAISFFFLGIFVFLLGCAARATRADGYDDTNMFNWLRVFFAVVIHPGDASKYHYCDKSGQSIRKVFDVGGDELSDVSNCRPPKNSS